ncbi:hypothetical protein [Kitasatospora sp. NPDC057500]|uniref:effector-associated constant component EACC1 n=1 Tax=Kitasatospora sp. NPDC057500 TaxID=3346151 RepID=UPI0036CB18B5
MTSERSGTPGGSGATERSEAGPGRIELSASDPSQLTSLERWLNDGPAGFEVARLTGTAGPGEQGALDVLAVLGGTSGIVAALRILPDFIRSRRKHFHIEIVHEGRTIVLDAENVDEVLPVLERLLGE